MKNLLKATAIAAMLLTAVACNVEETTTNADSKVDLSEGVHPISEITPEELATWAKMPPKEFAGGILGWETEVIVGWIEDNGREGTPESELSTEWRVAYEDGVANEMTADLVDGRHNLIVENGIVIGIIVEQIDGPDIHVGVTSPEKPLDLDCANTTFIGPPEMCSSENWESQPE